MPGVKTVRIIVPVVTIICYYTRINVWHLALPTLLKRMITGESHARLKIVVLLIFYCFGRCAPCHESCETCTGSNSSQCIRCPSGRFWNEGRCVGECPAHHYADYNQRECVECPPGCSECNASTCISCLDDWKVNIKGRCQTQASDKCDVGKKWFNI